MGNESPELLAWRLQIHRSILAPAWHWHTRGTPDEKSEGLGNKPLVAAFVHESLQYMDVTAAPNPIAQR